jgi:hypothetical protein
MTKHDDHLPRKDHNKRVDGTAKPSPRELSLIARIQGTGTKQDAKEAKKQKS